MDRFSGAGSGRLASDNNTVERAMRGVAVGRKNWLSCGSQAGGQHAAVNDSLIETAKRHGIDTFEYLRDLIERLPTHPAERKVELTPRAWKLERARAGRGAGLTRPRAWPWKSTGARSLPRQDQRRRNQFPERRTRHAHRRKKKPLPRVSATGAMENPAMTYFLAHAISSATTA